MEYYICPFRIASSEKWYAQPDGFQPQEVLATVTRDDFLRQNKKLLFTDKSGNHIYSHKYIYQPKDGIAVLKLANRYVDSDDEEFWRKRPWEDRLFTVIVIVSRKDGTCFYVEDNERAFDRVEDVVKILCRGLNHSLSSHQLFIGSDYNFIKQTDNYALMSACAIINQQLEDALNLQFGTCDAMKHEYDEKALLAAQLFTSALTDQRKASMVISLLYELTKGRKDRKALMCGLRAAMDAGVIIRPSYNDFITVFNCGHLVSKEQYSTYTNPNYHGYKKYELYKNAYIRFKQIKEAVI